MKRKADKVKIAEIRLKQGNFVKPSPRDIVIAATGSGGWTAKQLAEWGVAWPPPKGWRDILEKDYRNNHPES